MISTLIGTLLPYSATMELELRFIINPMHS